MPQTAEPAKLDIRQQFNILKTAFRLTQAKRRAGLSDKHKTLTLCVLCAFAVNSCLNNNELISKN
jgi:hypothetical protein